MVTSFYLYDSMAASWARSLKQPFRSTARVRRLTHHPVGTMAGAPPAAKQVEGVDDLSEALLRTVSKTVHAGTARPTSIQRWNRVPLRGRKTGDLLALR